MDAGELCGQCGMCRFQVPRCRKFLVAKVTLGSKRPLAPLQRRRAQRKHNHFQRFSLSLFHMRSHTFTLFLTWRGGQTSCCRHGERQSTRGDQTHCPRKMIMPRAHTISHFSSPGVVARPAVALAGEVDPLGVTKLVAHEVEVRLTAQRHRDLRQQEGMTKGY